MIPLYLSSTSTYVDIETPLKFDQAPDLAGSYSLITYSTVNLSTRSIGIHDLLHFPFPISGGDFMLHKARRIFLWWKTYNIQLRLILFCSD